MASNDPNLGNPDDVRRFRISLRGLLACVTVAGVMFALVGRTVQFYKLREGRRAVMREQYQVTDAILDRVRRNGWLQTRVDPNASWNLGGGGGHSGPSQWRCEQRRWVDLAENQRALGMSIEISGGLIDLEVRPITIDNRTGLYNELVIEELTAAYTKKKWAYEIVSGGDTTAAPVTGDSK